jgi:hypothetical protein
MLGATLIRDAVVQVSEPREQCLLAATGRMEPLQPKQLPRAGVVGLVSPGAGHRHLGLFQHRLPACFLGLKPLAYPGAVGLPCGAGALGGTVASPLAQRNHPAALPLAPPVQPGRTRRAPRLAHRRRAGHEVLRERVERLAQAGAQARSRDERAPTFARAGAASGEDTPDPLRRRRLGGGAWERLIRRGQGGGTRLLGRAPMPEPAPADERGPRDLVGETAAVCGLAPARDGQGQAPPEQPRHPTLRPQGPDEAVERQGRERRHPRAECHTAAAVRGPQRLTGALRAPRAVTPDELRPDRQHRFPPRALASPESDPTQADAPIMGMACQAPAAMTARLVWELKPEGEDARQPQCAPRFTVVTPAALGGFGATIARDGTGVSRRCGRGAHVSLLSHQVSEAAAT